MSGGSIMELYIILTIFNFIILFVMTMTCKKFIKFLEKIIEKI